MVSQLELGHGCSFLLNLRNLQRAVGAYFDFSFEDSSSYGGLTTLCTYSQDTMSVENPGASSTPPLFDVRIWPSSGVSGSPEVFKVTIENCGPSPWKDNFYVRSEVRPV